MTQAVRVRLSLGGGEPVADHTFADIRSAQRFVRGHDWPANRMTIEEVEMVRAGCPYCNGSGTWIEPRHIKTLTATELMGMQP